jgi:basic amino acid/polyamine antiporter, APA family
MALESEIQKPESKVEHPVLLERRLGLLNATAINMSNMVGTGPFITLPLMISAMGGPQALLGWLVGAVIAIADGMVWSELAAALPGSGGSYVYLRDSFNRNTWGRLWAFLFVFQLVCSGPLEIASGNIAIAQYLGYLIPGMTPWQVKLAAVLVGVLATFLLYRKITSIARLMVALWIGMLVTVGWLIVSGLWHFNAGVAFDFPPQAFTFSRGFFLGLSSSTLYVMYCYLGYYGVCYLGDEVKAPARTIPRAIIISILGVLAINFLVSLSIIGVVPWREVIASPFVAAVVMQRIYGAWAGVAMTLLIVWTAFASVYALILTYSRVPFAAAEDGNFFRLFSKVHPSKDFPHYAVLLVGGLSALAGLFDLADVITALLTARILVQFCGQIAALEFLRRFRHDVARPFRMWLYPLPSAIAFVGWIAIFLNSGGRYIAYGMATMTLGVIAYLIMARRGCFWPFQSRTTLLKILVWLPAFSLGACSTQPSTTAPGSAPPAITFHSIPDSEIWFRNSQIQLRFDREMYCRVYLYHDGSLRSINDIPPDPAKARPPHFITVSGEEIRDFQVDYKNVGASEIRTQFGAGRRLHLTGYAKTSQGVIIEKRLAVELYQDFPDTALVSATYRNTDPAASIVLTRSPSSYFRMDAARGLAGSASYDFWIAWGDAGNPAAVRIDLQYSRTFRSPQESGSPLVDLWTSRMGMAVGDLSNGNRDLLASVTVTPDQKVALEFQAPGSVQLGPNGTFSTPKTAWLVHAGDARVAGERYQELKRRLIGKGA